MTKVRKQSENLLSPTLKIDKKMIGNQGEPLILTITFTKVRTTIKASHPLSGARKLH
jgi:hypothetical protein